MTEYTDEKALQALIAESPELLGSGGRAAVVRELTVPQVGSLDLAAVGASGKITLVECKLAANPEIRRHVIGQVFAYAAGLWSLSFDEFDRLFAIRAGVPLAKAVEQAAGVDADWDEEAFRQAVAANLETGRFDLVVAVDSITDELKKVIRYLNEHTVAEIRVLALELGYVADGDVEVLIPTVYGDESATRKTQTSSRHVWDEASLFKVLERLCPEGVPVIRQLYDFAVRNDNYFYWGDGASPSVTAYLTVGGVKAPVWSCYTREGSFGCSWDVNFDWMRSRGVPEATMKVLLDCLLAIPGVAARLQGVQDSGWRRRPSLPISPLLTTPGTAEQLMTAVSAVTGSGSGDQ